MSLDGDSTLAAAEPKVSPALARDLARAALALARRFAAGGTLWCWAPAWPEHASHVAVEFVHPVIMGTRALPAAVVDGPDPVATLRAVAEPGDALIAVAAGDERDVAETMMRAEAWDVETTWIGAGAPRPPTGADHVVWFDRDAPTAAHDGTFVLAYHVLWELTHVCFEHPGLVTPEAPSDGNVCITCSDEGRVAEVVGPGAGAGTLVRAAGRIEAVDTTLVEPVSAGELVLVHAGVAISRVGAPA